MRMFLVYTFLEGKRSVRILGKSLAGMLLAALLLSGAVCGISDAAGYGQPVKKIPVALVIPEGEDMTRMVMELVASMESISQVCTFQETTKEIAWEGMRSGEMEAVIEIPEYFFMDVYTGKNTPATVYVSEASGSRGAWFMELLLAGVELLQIAEAGVYASLDLADIEETKMPAEEIGDWMARRYGEEILGREKLFHRILVSPYGEVDAVQYYVCAVFLLILMLYGLRYGFLYERKEQVVSETLRSHGMGTLKLSAGKVLVMAGSLWMMFFLLYGGCGLILQGFGVALWEIRAGSVMGMALLCFSMAAFFHLIYTMAGDSGQGVVLLLAVLAGMVLCSGMLVPAAYLPQAAETIGKWLPAGLWSRYGQQLLFGTVSAGDSFLLLGEGILCMGTGAVFLWKRYWSGTGCGSKAV